jgi:hypothetical protein
MAEGFEHGFEDGWAMDSKVATVGVTSSTEYNARVGLVERLIRIHDEVQRRELRKRRDTSLVI